MDNYCDTFSDQEELTRRNLGKINAYKRQKDREIKNERASVSLGNSIDCFLTINKRLRKELDDQFIDNTKNFSAKNLYICILTTLVGIISLAVYDRFFYRTDCRKMLVENPELGHLKRIGRISFNDISIISKITS